MGVMVNILSRLFGSKTDPRETLRAAYNNCIQAARAPHWYARGGAPDTLDGRFDMLAAVVSMALLRLEKAPEHMQDSVFLTELFIADMDEQLRQIGIGDVGIAKQVGRIMSAMGGRLGAYRDALAPDAPVGALEEALLRNLWRGEAGGDADPAYVATHLSRLHDGLLAIAPQRIITGAWPAPTAG